MSYALLAVIGAASAGALANLAVDRVAPGIAPLVALVVMAGGLLAAALRQRRA